MCIGGRLGLALDLAVDDPVRALFGETNGCLLAEVRAEDAASFEKLLKNLPKLRIATILDVPTFIVNNAGKELFLVATDELVAAFNMSH
jgi:hypothetical protein